MIVSVFSRAARTSTIGVFLGLVLGIVGSNAATLEDFSAVAAGSPHYAGTWEISGDLVGSTSPAGDLSQGAGVYEISGTGVFNDAGSYLEIHLSSSADLGSQPALEVSAQSLAGNEASAFEIRLFDSAGRSAYAVFLTSDFPTGDNATVTAPMVKHHEFDDSTVETLRISGGQLAGSDAFAVSFDAIGTSAGSFHDADSDRDGILSLSELLRVIEIYNTRFGTRRTGAYRLASSSPDGFEVAGDIDEGVANPLARYHSADYGRDGRVSLSELLRVIELYNFREGTTRVGAYRIDPDTVDGFRPGRRE